MDRYKTTYQLRPSIIIIALLSLSISQYSCKKDTTEEQEEITSTIPFPNHTEYTADHIKPNDYSQTELDNQTKDYYLNWKTAYLKNDCSADQYYIYSENDAKCISEAQGYGMMIMCYMAGYENNAKEYFDGLYRYYKAHPSNINSALMDWQQITCNDLASEDDDAASDGDIDIAFSLLLAHKQWTSDGDINYLNEAIDIIHAIMDDEINHDTWTVKLGDWSDSSDPNYYYGTRSSDFITSHFKAFSMVSSNTDWNLVIDECYEIVNTIQSNEGATTGLVPDFIINTNTNPIAAGQNYLEDPHDGHYYYNACRVPLRLGIDYLLTGDTRAKTATNKINNWLISSTSSNSSTISNGYTLDGTAIYDWHDASFVAPLVVGAMNDSSNQAWLNNLYEELISDDTAGDYYSNTLRLISMIVISGNYWNP